MQESYAGLDRFHSHDLDRRSTRARLAIKQLPSRDGAADACVLCGTSV